MNRIASSRILMAYQAQSVKRPYATASLSSATLFCLGDIVSQQAVARKGLKNHDFASTLRMTLYGACIFGPAATAWYRVLEKNVVIKGSNAATAIARTACDQLLFAPVGIATFFTCMAIMEGETPKKKVQEKWAGTLWSNWAIWPAVQVVNFTFVPLNLRLVVVNFVSIGWNAYMAHVNSKKSPTDSDIKLQAGIVEKI